MPRASASRALVSAAALVDAGMLSVLLLPLIAFSLRSRTAAKVASA
jgi:hypothetical protein